MHSLFENPIPSFENSVDPDLLASSGPTLSPHNETYE